MRGPIADWKAEAKAEGVEDAYGFAEWLVGEKEHFGKPEKMPEYELEMAYEQAMDWWSRA